MAIDPELYEKVTGRSVGDAERRMGESLAQGVRDRERTEERMSYFRTWIFWGSEGVLIRWLLERWGYFGLLLLALALAGLTWYFLA